MKLNKKNLEILRGGRTEMLALKRRMDAIYFECVARVALQDEERKPDWISLFLTEESCVEKDLIEALKKIN